MRESRSPTPMMRGTFAPRGTGTRITGELHWGTVNLFTATFVVAAALMAAFAVLLIVEDAEGVGVAVCVVSAILLSLVALLLLIVTELSTGVETHTIRSMLLALDDHECDDQGGRPS